MAQEGRIMDQRICRVDSLFVLYLQIRYPKMHSVETARTVSYVMVYEPLYSCEGV